MKKVKNYVGLLICALAVHTNAVCADRDPTQPTPEPSQPAPSPAPDPKDDKDGGSGGSDGGCVIA